MFPGQMSVLRSPRKVIPLEHLAWVRDAGKSPRLWNPLPGGSTTLSLTAAQRARFEAKIDASGGRDACWIWTAGTINGYGAFHIGRVTVKAHRLAWSLWRGAIPDGLCVLHRCDNPPCVNPEHLFLGTRKDNSADMAAKGRAASGERSARAKLTRAAVRVIRLSRLSGRRLAAQFGVSESAISRVRRRNRWPAIRTER